MQKRKFWEIVFQWVFPCALLVVALVLSIYEFNNKMNSAIQLSLIHISEPTRPY